MVSPSKQIGKYILPSEMNIDQAKHNFLKFKENYEFFKADDLTESDTRSKLLDALLVQVLGWEERDIKREGYTKEGYYDYLLSVPNFKFVVEAKKQFNMFKLPTKHRVVTFGTIQKENSDVLSQIRGYLFEIGLQYGVITNGTQIIIGKLITSDGTPWVSNKCLIFSGLDDIESRFVEFYNCLSKIAVVENIGFDFLKEEIVKGQTVTSNIANKDSELIRNSLSSGLTPIINDLFGEIYKYDLLDDKTLIEKCFVENEEIKKNKSEIEKLFADKPPVLAEVIPIRNTKNLASSIKSEIGGDIVSLKTISPPKPIIIVGSKGAGKTTFINYLFKVSFDVEFLKKKPYIHIDFRSYTEEDLTNIDYKVLRDSLNYLYDSYPEYELYSNKVLKRIYINEIKQKDASTWAYNKSNDEKSYNQQLDSFLEANQADFENHFIKLSEYMIRERSLRLCVIIDNADQFDMDIQRKAFLFAQSINRRAKCAVVISLREGYYYTWRNKPPFDAFASNVYHVTAPPYRDVLQKRIDYALENFKLSGRTVGSIDSGLRIDLGNNALRDFLMSVNKSLFGKENSEMLEFLEETTYPNIREGLEIFKLFLLSGHTNVDQYVLRQRTDTESQNPVPIWEFIKAVALENKKYYNHIFSRIPNLFYPVEGNRSHFLKIKILYYLKSQLDKLGYKEKFTAVQEIVDDFSAANYKTGIILDELKKLLEYGLIESEDLTSDRDTMTNISLEKSLSISLKGNYYINTLLPSFAYFDLVVQDTPIFLEESYTKIKSAFPLSQENGKRDITKRRQTVMFFIEYLKNREERETVDNDKVPTNIMLDIMSNGLEQEIGRLRYQS